MKANDIRCSHDLSLFNSLSSSNEVKRVQRAIKEHDEKNSTNDTRRQLLSTSIRLTSSISPRLNELAEDCINKLGITIPVEFYVYSSPQHNAACFKPEEGMLYIMFSSSLLEDFTEKEIKFVLGHELGHHLYQHHDIPIGVLLNSQKISTELALQLFSWSRYAEISADRAGAFCTGEVQSAATTLFKLSSGVSKSPLIKFDLNEFLQQMKDLRTDTMDNKSSSQMKDWFSTHPFSPLRVQALVDFSESTVFDQNQSLSREDLEFKIKNTLSFMEPDYLKGKTSDARSMKDVFIAASVTLANASNGFSKEEKDAIHKLLDNSIDVEKINLESIQSDLPKRVTEVNEKCSVAQKMQILRDLIFISKVDNEIQKEELTFLKEFCEDLLISQDFLTEQLSSTWALD